ncbi:hypothetical protein [Rickettsia sp. TH2014]|uniref:hypothetical protein n=1 Tax=Rickettsia sp. TH2014 TaxID=1967503 RepID=UPI001C43BD08|nr:hypothetical protein [Rickettsia sp. TH2014]
MVLNQTKLITRNTKKVFLKIQATEVAVYAAIKNDHKQTAEELIKEVLKNADLHLTVFSV